MTDEAKVRCFRCRHSLLLHTNTRSGKCAGNIGEFGYIRCNCSKFRPEEVIPMQEYMRKIMEKQFDVIGEPFDEEYIQQKNWFQKHSWNPIQKQEFRSWVREYLLHNHIARKALIGSVSVSKKNIDKWIERYDADKGWKDGTL